MKEVTPYFQKAMLLAEIGWENRPPFLSPASSNGNEDGEPDGAGGDFSRLVHTGPSELGGARGAAAPQCFDFYVLGHATSCHVTMCPRLDFSTCLRPCCAHGKT